MKLRRPAIRLLGMSLLLVLVACRQEAPTPVPAPTQAPPAAPAPAPAPAPVVALTDISESTPKFVVGVSYPPAVNKYPGLAAALQQYTTAARAELQDAVDGIGEAPSAGPYDLSLEFSLLEETPRLVAVAADGSSYTGGAHGNPLIARFVWLVQEQKLLTAPELVPEAKGWEAISDYVREQLHTSLSQRIDDETLEPAERADLIKSAGRMIDEGTAPDSGNFAQFEPVLGADGRIQALRFVFPPYQVGPYSDGKQSADVPAEVLLPRVAAAYRPLFAGG